VRSRREWECEAGRWPHQALYIEIPRGCGIKGASRDRSNKRGLLVPSGATDTPTLGSRRFPPNLGGLPHPKGQIRLVVAFLDLSAASPHMNGKTTREWRNLGRFVGRREFGTGEVVKMVQVGVRKILMVLERLGRRKAGTSITFPVRQRPRACFGWRRPMKGILPFWNRGCQSSESIGGALLEPRTSAEVWSIFPPTNSLRTG